MEIKVVGFKWKQKMLITGHYEFEIVVKDKETEIRIFRRFSDIEWLHKGLIKENPGCKILPLPEKSMWCNLNLNNKQELEKRQQSIETYLNYVGKHQYLFKNSYFLRFISQNYSLSKMKEEDNSYTNNESNKPKGIMGKVYGLASYLPAWGISKPQTKRKEESINDPEVNVEKENFDRLLTGTKDLIESITKHLEINEKKTESIGNLVQLAKQMNYKGIDYNRINDDSEDDFGGGEESRSKDKDDKLKHLEHNLEVLNSYYNKSLSYQNKIESNILSKLKEYKFELDGIIEIFGRKKEHEDLLKDLITTKDSNDCQDIKKIETAINAKEEFMRDLNQQLKYEMEMFKKNTEGQLLTIIKAFYKDKYEKDIEIEEYFRQKDH